MDIGQWLRNLGLQQYEPAFRENRVDESVLTKLTTEDIRDLGVTPVGDRRKLLDAIAKLREHTEIRPSVPASPPVETDLSAHLGEAERRQVTVLFCDLADSTSLALQLDPEDLRDVIGSYHKCCTREITRFGGFVAKYLGDGVLAYFGYPQAHDDDAEQAIQAGLSLSLAVPTCGPKPDRLLQVRVGIATGLAVVGDLIGEGAAQERNIVGETPNLAARLQAVAEPGQVIVSENTRRLSRGLFEYRDLGQVPLRGFPTPIQAWHVVKEAGVDSRFEALHGSRVAPLAGREEELNLLLGRWHQVKAGDGQAAVIVGEPGLGKSRLAVALDQCLAEERHRVAWCFCSPHHLDSALYPIVRYLERAADFANPDLVSDKQAKLERYLEQSPIETAIALPLLSSLLSLPMEAAANFADLSPQMRRQLTITTLLEHFASMAQQQPLLIIFEDVHWIDPTSLELLGHLVDQARNLRLLLVITTRPEFSPPWPAHSHIATLSLRHLSPRDAEFIVKQITTEQPLPQLIMDQIIARTDGIPLFIEELTQSILESGLLQQVSDGNTEEALSRLAIPMTLQDSLMARLDRLGAAKEIAQVGSCIGREFQAAIVAAVMGTPHLDTGLTQLVNAGLLFRRGDGQHATFIFKHALVRDAAYSSMLKARRQRWHERIAGTLEDLRRKSEVLVSPEVLAYHFQQGPNIAAAVSYWIEAGDFAEHRGMGREAVAHYRTAAQLMDLLESDHRVRAGEPGLLMKLGSALLQVEGYGSGASLDAYRRARSLAERHGQADKVVRAGIGGAPILFSDGRYREALQIMGEASPDHLAELPSQTRVHLLTMHSVAQFGLGDFLLAWDLDDRACSLDAETPCTHANPIGGGDPAIVARAYASMAGTVLGYFDRCLALAQEALEIARSRNHAFTIAWALQGKARAYGNVAAYADQLACAEEAASICERHGFEARLGTVLMQRGAAYFGLGQMQTALVDARRGLDIWRKKSHRFHMSYYLSEYVDMMIRCGKIGEAEIALSEAEQIVAETDEKSHAAELYRLRGIMWELAGEQQKA
jgi:class 3 adenylate cyclase/tetratricopeptide (TPR) repeat protein